MRKRLFFTLFFYLLLCGSVFPQNSLKGSKQITPELLKRYIHFLSSDSMKGRSTPSPELDMAAAYIADELAASGIQPVHGSYFQNISLCTKNLDTDKCGLTITSGEGSKSFRLKTDYVPFEMTADTSVKSSLVFAGYGITAPEYNYDDYKDVDVKGKVVLVMKHEPGEKDAISLFEGVKETPHSLLKTKVDNAVKHGASGLLVVTDPLNHLLLTPQGYPWPSLSQFLPQGNLPVELLSEKNQIPVVQVGEPVIKFLFGSLDSLKRLQTKIDKSNTPFSFPIGHAGCELKTKLKVNPLSAKNVVGILEGSNPALKDEFVCIGGHYDHVGIMKNHKEGEDFIYNGADDNASGTAGVMAIAKAFGSMKKRPERSILFILFAGEERGLYGSRYYCENPLVPLEKSVVMLNLDMISRNGKDTLQLDGLKQNPDLAALLLKEAKKLKMKNIPGDEDLFGRSDHYNFFKRGISGLNITSGLHKDYHTVSDNPESTDPVKAAMISRMTFNTARIIANNKLYLNIVTK